MTLLSANDDFVKTTLAGVAGILEKLEYVSGLRQAEGGYAHWGLARVHGEQPAQRAMAEAHRRLFLEILRTPVRQLVRELASPTAPGFEAEALLEALRARQRDLMPASLGGGSERHFNSIFAALLALTRSSTDATRSTA